MAKLSPEIIEKIKEAQRAEDLIVLAKEYGIVLSNEAAEAQFAELHAKQGELSDDELDNVSGGACVTVTAATCPKCGSENVSMAGTQDYPLITCHACGFSNKDSVI